MWRVVVLLLAAVVAINAHCIVVCGLTQTPMPTHCHGHNCGKCAPQQPPFAKVSVEPFTPAIGVAALVAEPPAAFTAGRAVPQLAVNTGPPLTPTLRI